MAILTALDHNLFALLNGSLTSSFLDWFMPLITDAKTWMPLIAIIWLGLLFSGRPQMRVLALALLVSVGLTDLVCARVFKKAGARLRPCELSQKTDFKCRLLLPMKTSKSFPSNHAANTAAFAAAMFFMCGIKAGWPFFILAFLVGYSRVYVGVHFPMDVLAGWFFGILIALFVCRIVRKKWPSQGSAAPECQAPPVAQ